MVKKYVVKNNFLNVNHLSARYYCSKKKARENPQSTIFDKIIDGSIPADFVYKDEKCVAFRDVNPQAPTHILIIPRTNIPSISEMNPEDANLVGHLMYVAKLVAEKEKLDKGYRLALVFPPSSMTGVDLAQSSSINVLGMEIGYLFRARRYFSSSQIATLFKAQVRPSMEYYSHIWGGAPASILGVLDRIQKKAIRLVDDESFTTNLQLLSHQWDEDPLSLFDLNDPGIFSDFPPEKNAGTLGLGFQPVQETKCFPPLSFSKASDLRKKHRAAEKRILERTREAQKRLGKRYCLKGSLKKKLMEAVINNGGPCISAVDVNLALQGVEMDDELEILKNEARYLKQVLGLKDKRLIFGENSAMELKRDLK
ncbi:Histidine triad nucleotide-binding protein 2, mitochondrial [Nymphon striatum]|nr:Histidine triad nucleotide-binding protein 2, mitochondrial [Nymphon striatum]